MLRKSIFLLTLCLGLAACEDPAERAERYYQSALGLLEEGDTERALLQLRNVFDADGTHVEARQLYADLVLEQGDLKQAYGQYLRLVEQDPDRIEARLTLANLAIDTGDWEEVARHARAALALEPDRPEARAFALMLAYRDARIARDDVAAGAQVAAAQALLETDPDVEVAQRLMIDWLVSGPDPERALPYIDAILARRPNSFGLQMIRLSVLAEAEREEEITAHLHNMYVLFPEAPVVAQQLIQWHLSREEFDVVERFLRERAGPDEGNFEDHVAVVQLLEQTQGPAAAAAELDRLAAANAATDLGRRYRLLLLGLQVDAEDLAPTAAALEALIGEIETTDLRNEARIALVRLRGMQGDAVAAQALTEEVLASDPSNVQGLLLRAAWRIQGETYGQAITDLRQALDQDPRNADVLLLLAEAHQKLGNVALSEQSLARAVEASGSAPREALIFARFQLARGNLGAADRVLTESLRASGDLEVAALLGQVLLRRSDFDGVAGVIAELEARETPEADELAQSLQAAMLFSQNRIDESLDALRSNLDDAADTQNNFETDLQILRVQMLSGRFDEARAQLQKLRGQYPDSLALRLLQGNILSLEGNPEGAIAIYRQLLAENPAELLVIQQLYSALQEAGRRDEAATVLTASLQRVPEARSLQMLRALEHEMQGQHEAAIAIYEELYARNSNDIAVANNLASVLAYYRTTPADIERAHQIALRLAGSSQPEFLDTLGYIQLRRGDAEEAVLNLQAAARGLPDNPSVAFNLAMAYAAADRPDEAREELARGFDLAGDLPNVPQMAKARALARELGG